MIANQFCINYCCCRLKNRSNTHCADNGRICVLATVFHYYIFCYCLIIYFVYFILWFLFSLCCTTLMFQRRKKESEFSHSRNGKSKMGDNRFLLFVHFGAKPLAQPSEKKKYRNISAKPAKHTDGNNNVLSLYRCKLLTSVFAHKYITTKYGSHFQSPFREFSFRNEPK